MILELHLNFMNDKMLLSSWEFKYDIWQSKQHKILSFFKKTLTSNHINFKYKKEYGNIIFEISGKPHLFYDVQNVLDEYFSSLKAEQLVV
jgi:hypothetical protein